MNEQKQQPLTINQRVTLESIKQNAEEISRLRARNAALESENAELRERLRTLNQDEHKDIKTV